MPISLEPMTLGDLITRLIVLDGIAPAMKNFPIVLGPDDQPLRQIIMSHGMIYLSEDARPRNA
jgi:hypothetical protein